MGVAGLLDVDRADWSLLRGFDGLGLGLVAMALFLGCFDSVLDEGPKDDWLDDPTIATCSAVAAIAAVTFFWRVLTNPIVDLRNFRIRNFAIGCIMSFVLGVGLYGAVFLMPQFLARVRGTMIPGDPDMAATEELARIVEREACVLTYNDMFLLVARVFFAALLLMPLVKRPSDAAGAAGGHWSGRIVTTLAAQVGASFRTTPSCLLIT